MNLFLRIGFILDILSLVAFFGRVLFNGHDILIPIQMGLFFPGIIMITIGVIKTRRAYHESEE